MKLSPEQTRKCLELAGQKPLPLADTISEKDFQAAVLALAKENGWLCYHTHDSRKSQAGFPDLVMVRGVHLIFVELKTEDGKLGADQHNWIEALRGVERINVWVWRPSNWPIIVKILTA